MLLEAVFELLQARDPDPLEATEGVGRDWGVEYLVE